VSGFYLRGAFVQFMDTFLVPLPNVIVFQFNPEQMTHTWSAASGTDDDSPGRNPLAVKGVPGEEVSFTLAMDSSDMIADGSLIAEGIALSTGIYSRLAALEMLQYPVSPGANGFGELVGSVLSGVGLSGVKRPVPEAQLPTVLFVWGPGRILPVKVTSLQITETLYDFLLNPTHAEASVGLTVLTPDELKAVSGPLRDVARGAYVYSQGLRQTLAAVNLANSAESVIGMLPL
jgi:hypothetical protein